MTEVRLSPPHSILFILDPTAVADVPDVSGDLVSATSSCVAIGTLAEMDGETTVILEKAVSDPSGHLVFNGEITTPSRRLAVTRSDVSLVSELAVSKDRARLRIWANDPSEPDLITIEAS